MENKEIAQEIVRGSYMKILMYISCLLFSFIYSFFNNLGLLVQFLFSLNLYNSPSELHIFLFNSKGSKDSNLFLLKTIVSTISPLICRLS